MFVTPLWPINPNGAQVPHGRWETMLFVQKAFSFSFWTWRTTSPCTLASRYGTWRVVAAIIPEKHNIQLSMLSQSLCFMKNNLLSKSSFVPFHGHPGGHMLRGSIHKWKDFGFPKIGHPIKESHLNQAYLHWNLHKWEKLFTVYVHWDFSVVIEQLL